MYSCIAILPRVRINDDDDDDDDDVSLSRIRYVALFRVYN